MSVMDMDCTPSAAKPATELKMLIAIIINRIILEKAVERGIIVQDIGFTVLSKNFSFTLRLSGHFLEVLWNQ